MFTRILTVAAATGAALLAGLGTASAAPAHIPSGDHDHGNYTISILGNACVAPWQWNGPLEAGTVGHGAGYAACNGNSTNTNGGEGYTLSILDNACVAPWQWNGPIEALTAGHWVEYAACNDNVANG
ncbi:hypothetical protein [Actinokineospora sp. HUAS TT18]|uniref:hypothetical protein n=1 Tax=Actinokineospora sp. HUAS TT18 TaxID=3447451 RepID=UPI003F52029D